MGEEHRDVTDELIESGSKYGLYRPEIKDNPGPLTFKQAKRKYRMTEGEPPSMAEFAIKMKTRQFGVARHTSNSRGRANNLELTYPLGQSYLTPRSQHQSKRDPIKRFHYNENASVVHA